MTNVQNGKSHNGRELELMLAGLKPLAVFYDVITEDVTADDLDRAFDTYVSDGSICKHVAVSPGLKKGFIHEDAVTRTRFFYLPGQYWRVEAWINLWRSQDVGHWSDALEKASCLLLGYSDDDVEAWLKELKRKRCAWGAVTVYCFLNAEDLWLTKLLGFRAFHPATSVPLFCAGYEEGPNRKLLEEVCGYSDVGSMVRFGLETRFFLRQQHRFVSSSMVVSFESSDIEALNINLRSSIEICTCLDV